MSQDPRMLLKQAEKAIQAASGGFSLFGGRTEKWENAADSLKLAANAFKLQKQFLEAGKTFEQMADIQKNKLNELGDMANTLQDAGKAYGKAFPAEAARVNETAIQYYAQQGNFRRAATLQATLAEIYETDIGDQKKALEAHDTAGQWFEGDNAEALANKHFLKAADLAALEGDYPRAVKLFEAVARSSVKMSALSWSLKDYLLKAGICHLAIGDIVATKRALESYRELDHNFASTREHMLLVDLIGAVEEGDQEGFSDKLFQYDQLSKLDKWKTTLLLRIKNDIEKEEEDFS